MTATIVTIAILATTATILATMSNFVIAREFPAHDPRRDLYLPLDRALQVTNYRLAAKLFYLESLVLWCGFILLLGAKLIFNL